LPSARAHLRLRFAWLLLASPVAARAQTPLLPSGVAYDAAGNLYFAGTNRQQVFESTLAGALLVVAGSGTQGFAGDGGAATAAQLNSPQSVAIGPDGTLYIADTGNQRIRAVSTAGTITTFAGTGSVGYGGDHGPATSAIFHHPNALAIDASGALLVCDSGNHRVRRISAGQVTTIAGTGVQGLGGDGAAATAAQLDTPAGIAVAADGRIFIADTHNQRVRVVATSGNISTFAGTGVAGYAGDGGAATSAQLAQPRGLFATAGGALLIADSNNQRIRMVDASGAISTLAGNGTQGSSSDGAAAATASLNTPRGVALSAFSAPVFADAGNSMVRELVANGNLYSPAGLATARTSTVTLTAASGAATVTVSGSAGTPQGAVELYDGSSSIGQVSLIAGTAAFSTAPLTVGTHTLSAAYLGDGVNPAATSASMTTIVGQTASVTTMQPVQSSYAGLPLVLTANVASAAQTGALGTPTGTVLFTEGASTVATATLSAGAASGVFLSPAAGGQQIVASYSGDANFLPSATTISVTVSAMPDFVLTTTGSASQTVLAGAIATYNFIVAANPMPFTGAVSMSVRGLPTGVTAAFSPTQVVPGTGTAQVTLSLQSSASMVRSDGLRMGRIAVWAMLLPLIVLTRRRMRQPVPVCAVLLLLTSATGCGDRSLSAASQANLTFSLTVADTGTNLAGAVVVHSTPITLVVQ
jgi:sugar lactone lactonase YvrE